MSALGNEESQFPAATILAADDSPANLLALSAILEPLDASLVTVQSGAETLARVGASSADLAVILLDVMMPEMDGFETLTRLRAIPEGEHIPVILLTAFDLDALAMDRVRGKGTVDYVLKPIAPELLRSKVAAFVSLHRRGEELRRRGEALVAKDRDIAILAHDLQNPLTTISAASSLLLREDLSTRARGNAERISRVVARMGEMIRNLTDFARAGRGAIPIAPESMDLDHLCRELIDDFQSAASGRQIDLACSGSMRGAWDRNRLHQAISNLLANALRYGTGPVVVRACGDEAGAEVAVRNDGPPIASDRLPRLFEPFERGEQDRSGLGLGLYIVREIARAHRGVISVTSSAENGTTFVLTLPKSR